MSCDKFPGYQILKILSNPLNLGSNAQPQKEKGSAQSDTPFYHVSAGRGSRTPTPVRAYAPETYASTNSAIPANRCCFKSGDKVTRVFLLCNGLGKKGGKFLLIRVRYSPIPLPQVEKYAAPDISYHSNCLLGRRGAGHALDRKNPARLSRCRH